MKLFYRLIVLGLACLLVMACTEKSPTTIGQVEQNDSDATSQAAVSESTEPTEIDGTLMQTEKGLAIVTGTDAYIVHGQDLSDMIGQTVKITGTVAEVDGGRVIQVMAVAPLE